MRRLLAWAFGLLLGVVLAGCASTPALAPSSEPADAPPYDAWARVLERFVDDEGRVDFAGVAAEPADLDHYLGYVHRVSPASHPAQFASREAVLAYHLNTYNALALRKVIDAGIPRTLAGLRKVGFFYFGKQPVGGLPITLYDYENQVIRPLGDARVHVALNCMSVGCPRLPREPFLPETLDAQLDREARLFFSEPRNVQVDDAARVLRLSEILKFYTDDFLRSAPTLAAYANRYRDAPLPEDYEVRFIPYDWSIKRQPGR